MAHFIGYIKGNRREVKRIGTKNSGLDAAARGWKLGGSVNVYHMKVDPNGSKEAYEADHVRFTLDGGSSGKSSTLLLAEVVAGTERKTGTRAFSLRLFATPQEIKDWCKSQT